MHNVPKKFRSAAAVIILHALLVLSSAAQQDIVAPKWEVRAVWLTTAGGADWPKTLQCRCTKKIAGRYF